MIKSIAHDRDHAIIWFTGVVTFEEIVESRKAVIYNPEYKHRKYHVWFFDRVTDMIMTSSQMKVLRTEDATNAKLNPDLRVSLVGNTDISYGMVRMYQSYVDVTWRHVAVFRDYDEGLKWARQD